VLVWLRIGTNGALVNSVMNLRDSCCCIPVVFPVVPCSRLSHNVMQNKEWQVDLYVQETGFLATRHQ
jgi:hypothetical protein